ncbi:hypothetical protein SBA2_270025 [Acidobacteriia bacterium SbA2]|nr:hypothetical protein SBA2_270025 [Acidobacteriia bacterium SbA2]
MYVDTLTGRCRDHLSLLPVQLADPIHGYQSLSGDGRLEQSRAERGYVVPDHLLYCGDNNRIRRMR